MIPAAVAFLLVHLPADPARLAGVFQGRVENAPSSIDKIRYLSDFGHFLRLLPAPDRARGPLEQAIDLSHRTPECPPELAATALEELAAISAPRVRLDLLQRAVALRVRSGGHSPREVLGLYRQIADLHLGAGESVTALTILRKALASAGASLPPVDPALAAALVDLGYIYEQQENFRAAESHYRRALSIQRKSLGPSHPEVGVTLNNLAGVVGAQGNLTQAEKLLREALRAIERNLGPWHTRVAVCAANLGDLLAATRRPGPARSSFQRALAIYERAGDTAAANDVRQSLASLR